MIMIKLGSNSNLYIFYDCSIIIDSCLCYLGIVQGALKTERGNRTAWLPWNKSWMLVRWKNKKVISSLVNRIFFLLSSFTFGAFYFHFFLFALVRYSTRVCVKEMRLQEYLIFFLMVNNNFSY